MKADIELGLITWKEIEFWDMVQELTQNTQHEYDLYLSGQMTGIYRHNYPLFNRVAVALRGVNLRVFNPAENFNGDSTLPRATYLRKDIQAVCRSGAILLLDDWHKSAGATCELHVASQCGLKVYRLNTKDKKYFKYYDV